MKDEVEQRLIQDLARLRLQPPFSVDVTARVLAEVRRMGPPPRQTIATRRVVAWSVAAALLLAAGVALAVLPGLPARVGELAQAVSRAAGYGGTVLGYLSQVPGAVARGIAWVAGVLDAFRGLGGLLGPAVAAAMAAGLMGMAGITAIVVGRDLRRGRVEAR